MHRKLADSASPAIIGRFYRALLERRLWATQRQLAEAFGVSDTQVSRALAAARLPPEIRRAFGGESRISHRAAQRILFIVAQLGADVVRERAAKIPSGASLADIETALLTGRLPHADFDLRITVASGQGGKYLRIDSTQLDQLIPHVGQMELLLRAMISPMRK
jgi:hypothetical protein